MKTPIALFTILLISGQSVAQNTPLFQQVNSRPKGLSNLAEPTENVDSFLGQDKRGPYILTWKNIVFSTRDFTSFSQTFTDVFKFEISAPINFAYTSNLVVTRFVQTDISTTDVDVFITFSSLVTYLGNFDFNFYMPKLKITDFLKGLFSMFKLVALPDDFGNIYVNNLDSYYKDGNVYDITKYVNSESYEVTRGKILNTINFNYEDPTAILNKQFKLVNNIAYGDEVTILQDADGVPLDGDKIDVKLPFENVLFERLEGSNIQYGYLVDDKIEPTTNKPIIFYNNNIELSGTKLSFVNENNTVSLIDTNLNTPATSLGFVDSNFCINWGVEFSSWDYVAMFNTLYKNYWSNYITSIFNIKKRQFKFDAMLPISLLTNLKLNDVLFIKERYYRINDFNVNLLTGQTTLNSFSKGRVKNSVVSKPLFQILRVIKNAVLW